MFIYRLDLSEEYYYLYGALYDGIINSYIVSASSPEIARELVNKHPGGGERNVSLGGFGLLDYGDRTNIWLHEKYVNVSKIGVSNIEEGIIIYQTK